MQQTDNLKIYAYVILENHLHLVAKSDDLSKTMAKYKSHTAIELLKLLKQRNIKTILDQLAFYKKAHKKDREYQVWQEGLQAKLIVSQDMMREKVEYIHNNPIKRSYVDRAEHWRYSSARDYIGQKGLIDIEMGW